MNDLVVEHAGSVATVTLDRGSMRNALNRELCSAIVATFTKLALADDVQVVILTGTDPAFCAGVDLKEFHLVGHAPDNLDMVFDVVATFPKPLIGAVNGAAVTGGLELALGCDFLVASDRASFADTHARVGLLPSGGLSVRLPQAVGLRQAKLMSLTGQPVTATQAWDLGLVVQVTPHDDLLGICGEIAAAIAANHPQVVVALKDLYAQCTAVTPVEGLTIERAAANRRRALRRAAADKRC